MTALMVCIRFSASSNTMEAGDSKTSSVTSMQSMPNFSKMERPIEVLRSWKEGQQCMNTHCEPALPMTADVTR